MYGETRSGLLTIDDVRPYLRNIKVQSNGEIRCSCPLCEYDDPHGHHLYIKATDDNVFMFCQKCKANGNELIRRFRELGAKHEITVVNTEPAKIVENYAHEYRNPDGQLAYCKQRIKYSNGHKEFRFFYVNEYGEKIYSKPNDCNVLYNLDLMQCALQQEEIPILYIVEGEKNADAMVSRGLLATTSNTGAKSNIKFSATDLEMLSRFPRKVVINDNDKPGEEYVNAWQDAEWIPINELWQECPQKGDVADYFAAGHGIEDIENWKFIKLDATYITSLSSNDLANDDFLNAIFKIKDKVERLKLLIIAEQHASDIGLGRKNFKELWKSFLEKHTSGVKNNGNYTRFQNAPIDNLKCGDWIADMTGVYRLKRNESDELEREYASMIPIFPSAILENQEDGTEKIAISFYKKETWRTVNIPKEVIVNTNKIIELATIGADVSSLTAKLLVKYFSDVINLNEGEALPTLKTVSHLGWHGDEFIPYSEEIKTDLERDFANVLNAIKSKGTLQEWIDFIKPLRKNKHLRLVLDSSFASVLVDKVNALSFFLHLYGTTGFGKTLSLMLASSVWGYPGKGGLVFPLNSTLNYIVKLAGVLRNIPLCGDELQMIKTSYDNYDRLIMTLSEGEEKGRLSKEIIARKKGSWNLCVLTTGEEPIVKYESGGGAINRVIEVYCDKPITDKGQEVAAFISKHYGVAGKHFIESLPEDDEIIESFQRLQESFSKTKSTSKQIMAISLLALADELTCQYLFKDKPLTVNDFAAFMKTEAEVDASERAWESLQGLIVRHIGKFNVIGSEESARLSQELWGRMTATEIFFVAGTLKTEFAKLGYRFDDFKQKWYEKGYIKKYGKDFSAPATIEKGSTRPRCVTINRTDWV